MKKLKLQMNISIDGFVADKTRELSWMTAETDRKQVQYLQELTDSIDTIVMGRKMAEESIPHWEKVAASQTDDAERDYAITFVRTPKIVFSRTLKNIDGNNVRAEGADLNKSIASLKRQGGKDIIVYGGANFVSELLKDNLIDELHLLVNPAALGDGLSIFQKSYKLKLVTSLSFDNSVVLNKYIPG